MGKHFNVKSKVKYKNDSIKRNGGRNKDVKEDYENIMYRDERGRYYTDSPLLITEKSMPPPLIILLISLLLKL